MEVRVRKDWRDALWRHWSARLIALGAAIQATILTWPESVLYLWSLLPEEARAMLPPRFSLFIPWLCFVLAMGAKLIKQKGKKENEDADSATAPAE